MPIVDIKHVTTYRYNRPVSFGKHRMMLLPRDDGDQKVLVYKLEITPKPIRLDWSRDIFGNHVATAQFDDCADELTLLWQIYSRCFLRRSRIGSTDIAEDLFA